MSKPDITGGVSIPFEPQKLDGSGSHKDFLTPFDAHDNVLRSSPEGEPQEFPKAVAHHKETGEPLIAKDADHEAELLANLDEEKYA